MENAAQRENFISDDKYSVSSSCMQDIEHMTTEIEAGRRNWIEAAETEGVLVSPLQRRLDSANWSCYGFLHSFPIPHEA